jgi:hypothetical protein
MRQSLNTILGISPSTRSMGYAVMSDGELIDWGVKTFKDKWSKEKGIKILNVFQRLVSDYKITKVCFKVSCPSKNSQHSDNVYCMLKNSAKEKRLKLSELSIEKLRHYCSEAKNKKDLIIFITRHLPELDSGSSRGNQYNYVRQFEAIAAIIATSPV